MNTGNSFWNCMELPFGALSPQLFLRLEFNNTKTFEFRHVQEAYLTVTVKGAVGSWTS